MSRLHVHYFLQSWSYYHEPIETHCRNCSWAAANWCTPITNQATCLCIWVSRKIRSLLMSFCWPKTTPIAAPIKSFALKTTWALIFAVLCILKLNAEKLLGAPNDVGHSTLADLLISCKMCRAQIHSPRLQLAESMIGLFYRDEPMPPLIFAWDDFLPVENKQDVTFNLVNNLLKITFLCTSMTRVCNSERESSWQAAWN